MQRVFLLLSVLLLHGSCKGQENKAPDVNHAPTKGSKGPAEVDTEATPAADERLDLHGAALPEGASGRLGSLRMLDRSIRNMVFTADGTQLISTHTDGYQIWNLDDGTRGRILEMKTPGNLMAVSPNGKMLATSADASRQILIWDLESGKGTLQIAAKSATIGLCFLDDRRLVTASENGSITNWKFKVTGAPSSETFQGEWKEPTAFGCSRQSQWIGIGTLEGDAYVMEAGANAATKLGAATKKINAVAIASDGTSFAFASADEQIYLWSQPVPGDALKIEAHKRTVIDLAFSPDNSRLYSTGGDSWFRVWNPADGELIDELLGAAGLDAQLMALSPDGSLIASWSQHSRERGSEAGRWWLWNARSGSPLLEPERHNLALTSVRFSPDGNSIATTSEDQTLRLWETKSSKNYKTLERGEGALGDLVYSADGKTIYSGGRDAVVRQWNWETGQVSVPVDAVGGAINRLALARDGSKIYTGDQIGRVWSWDLQTGNKIQALDRQGYSAIFDLDLSPDGSLLAIAGSARIIRVIDLNGGQELAQLNPGDTNANYAVRFSPDGKHLASGGDNHKIQIWNTSDWTRSSTLVGHDGTVRCLAYSPDGSRIVSGGNDELVKVWDSESGKELLTRTGHTDVISAIAVSPDGKSFASASRDRTALVWKMP
jgi:WD40 repeat protein